MEVFTMNAAGPGRRARAPGGEGDDRTADGRPPQARAGPAPAAELAPFNELQQLAERCGARRTRGSSSTCSATAGRARAVAPPAPARPQRRPLDDISPVFLVDHSACILCDRCSRACDEVKGNNVIGRTGKGRPAGIGFDLNDPMGESSCVQCGECMVSCPTSAITFKPVAQGRSSRADGASDVEMLMTAAELMADPLFAGVPPKFLLWQEGLVVRRRVKPGEVLCRQGDPGNTAFLIKSGQAGGHGLRPPTATATASGGLLSMLIGGQAPQAASRLPDRRSPGTSSWARWPA